MLGSWTGLLYSLKLFVKFLEYSATDESMLYIDVHVVVTMLLLLFKP